MSRMGVGGTAGAKCGAGMQVSLPAGWQTVRLESEPARAGERLPASAIGRASPATPYLAQQYPEGLFRHQVQAIRHALDGEQVCLATGTGSGKTLAFAAVALHHLLTDPSARVVALYPMRALGNEQARRWERTLADAGVDATVGRIDGSVPGPQREQILQTCRVLVMTPDVLHAWVMSRVATDEVHALLRHLRLVILDEIHTYSGVFGSNAAYLFRRLRHLCAVVDASPQFFAASATIRDPADHLQQLIGLPTVVVGEEAETSPRGALTLQFAAGPEGMDPVSAAVAVLEHLVQTTTLRFLAFADSRRMVESLILRLGQRRPDEGETEEHAGDGEAPSWRAEILPYRSGYEAHDREVIEARLGDQQLRGVVATSALELGLDIPGLDAVVLVGVPGSGTSLRQRLGRVGRGRPGLALILKGSLPIDQTLFQVPGALLAQPPGESTLYLENPRLQFIHALCLAGRGGEDDSLRGSTPDTDPAPTLATAMTWPDGFLARCQLVRDGDIPAQYQELQQRGGADPQIAFPLRDTGTTFRMVRTHLGQRTPLGSISGLHLLREAYPGAIYSYGGHAHRVIAIHHHTQEVVVRRIRSGGTTTPIIRPPTLSPQLQGDHPTRSVRLGALQLVECDLSVCESVLGFTERRGRSAERYDYPLSPGPDSVRFPRPSFAQWYLTTGVMLVHPALVDAGGLGRLSTLLYEALLLQIPLDRGDIQVGTGTVRRYEDAGDRRVPFLAFVDRTYGSLRLSSRLADPVLLGQVLERAITLLGASVCADADQAGHPAVLQQLVRDVAQPPIEATWVSAPVTVGDTASATNRTRVLLPGCEGISTRHGNQLFRIDRVWWHQSGEVRYSGSHGYIPGQVETVPARDILPAPGQEHWGWYDHDTGTVVPE